MPKHQRGLVLMVAALLLVVFVFVVSAQHQTDINNRMTQTADTSSGAAFESVQVQGSQTLTAQPTITHQP